MKVREICSFLDSAIPLSWQESYDNSGLQAGGMDSEVNSAILSTDVTEEVISEAVKHGAGLIITHHPLIFHPLKRVTGSSPAERILIKAIKAGIAIYSAHTNLDVMPEGVSRKMAEKLDLKNVKVLSPMKGKLLKLVTWVPESHAEKVREALFTAGAGVIGNYDSCSFNVPGTGTFRGNEKTSPFAGKKGKLHLENEVRIETVLHSHLREAVVNVLLSAHPYEEVAYDLYLLENEHPVSGLGASGELQEPLAEREFLKKLADVFGAEGTRYSPLTGRKIKRVALCGGAGAGLLKNAIAAGADAFVTADVKYHDFFEPDGRILLCDIGHFESEKFASEILYELIIKKFPTFALRFSEIYTNPINYF
jgi:dinuclear metal center YbgI/SA1388 family protein